MASFSNNDMHSKKKNGTYFDTLDTDAKSRYIEKISVIDNVDPYSIDNSRLSSSPGSLPGITYPDIVNYLVNNPSPYTLQDLKSYKGLEAYNQFVSGWVREVKSTVINGHHVVVGRKSKINHGTQLFRGTIGQAVVVDHTMYISGQIGMDPLTGNIVEGGITAETEQVMKNMKAILEEAGCDFGNVVKATVLLQDIGNFATVNEIYAKYFSERFPSRAAYQVAALPKGAAVEIEAIAVLGKIVDTH